MNRVGALVCAFLCAGCAPDDRRPLSDCAFGLYWAECGGNAAPVLGCDRESGDCRWFDGGETARGYEVSDCPPTDVCCHAFWPFDGFPGGDIQARVVEQMSLLRQGPIQRTPSNDLTVGFGIAEAELIPGTYYCEPSEGCSASTVARVVRVGVSIFVTIPSPRSRWEIEIVPGATPEEWTARFFYYQSAGREFGPFNSCNDHWGVGYEAAVTGTLTLVSEQTDDVGSVHGRFSGTLTLPSTERLEIVSMDF